MIQNITPLILRKFWKLCCLLKSILSFYLLDCWHSQHGDMGNLLPWPGIESGPPALGAWSLSHWITQEIQTISMFRESPGGLVVRIPGFHCSSTSSIPDLETEVLQGVLHGQHTQTHTHLCICVCVYTHIHTHTDTVFLKNNSIHFVKLPKWSDIFICIQGFCFDRIKLKFLRNVSCILNMTSFDLFSFLAFFF